MVRPLRDEDETFLYGQTVRHAIQRVRANRFTIIAISKRDLRIRFIRCTCLNEEKPASFLNYFGLRMFERGSKSPRLRYPLTSNWDFKRIIFNPDPFGRSYYLSADLDMCIRKVDKDSLFAGLYLGLNFDTSPRWFLSNLSIQNASKIDHEFIQIFFA